MRQFLFAAHLIPLIAACSLSTFGVTDGAASTTSTASTTSDPCGDQIVGDGEECDDGDSDDNDECTNQCTLAVCGDGVVQAGVEGCDDGNDVNVDDCSNSCVASRVVFVSSGIWTGELGGVAGADKKCQDAAKSVQLPNWHAFQAWLSDDSLSPRDRFDVDFTGVYRLTSGEAVVEHGWQDLIDGALLVSIRVTERGDALSGVDFAWTNTRSDGFPVDKPNCLNWTEGGAGSGKLPVLGHLAEAGPEWTADPNTFFNCEAQFHLYCFESAT